MKLTKKQLRKLIAEAFITDPAGVTSGINTTTEYTRDRPVDYKQDSTEIATPQLYGFLTRNKNEIKNFHEKGQSVYDKLIGTDALPETKIQLLTILYSYDIISDNELENIRLEIDLLTSPDFKQFRQQSAIDLEAREGEQDERELGIYLDLLNDPRYIKNTIRKMDKAFEAANEYIKDAIMETLQSRLGLGLDINQRKKYFGTQKNSFGDVDKFVEDNKYIILETLGGNFTGLDVFDIAIDNSSNLEEYFDSKLNSAILRAINELDGAGLLKKTDHFAPDIQMPQSTYDALDNNQRGRREDFYKKTGIKSAFSDDPYVANPNLPVVTEAMIRQMIREAFIKAKILK